MKQYARYQYLDGVSSVYGYDHLPPLSIIDFNGDMAFRDSAVVYAESKKDAELRLAEIADIAAAVRKRHTRD